MDIKMIKTLLNQIDKERIENADNLTIGELFSKLNQFEDSERVTFSNGRFFDGTYDSYRGYYKDLYIGFEDEDMGFNTVGKIKEVLNKALDDGEMEGYKGGEFSIEQDTLVWFATYGTTYEAEMIVDVIKVDDNILIITKEDEF